MILVGVDGRHETLKRLRLCMDPTELALQGRVLSRESSSWSTSGPPSRPWRARHGPGAAPRGIALVYRPSPTFSVGALRTRGRPKRRSSPSGKAYSAISTGGTTAMIGRREPSRLAAPTRVGEIGGTRLALPSSFIATSVCDGQLRRRSTIEPRRQGNGD